MAINKSMRRVLKALSFDGIEVEASRHLANLKAIDPMKIFYKTIDYKIYNGDHQIPVRIFLPGEKMEDDLPALLFFHGGGWVTESIDNYERICARLASATNHIVVSVEYRLAPEYPFPTGFYDCYMAAKAMFTNRFILNTDPDKITLIGDSAGGNLAAAVSLMARDQGEFLPKRQILIYPVTDAAEAVQKKSLEVYGSVCGTEEHPTPVLTSYFKNIKADAGKPYASPLLADDLEGLPKALFIQAECDGLVDDGLMYAKRLKDAGVPVECKVYEGMPHAFILRTYSETFEALDQICAFLKK